MRSRAHTSNTVEAAMNEKIITGKGFELERAAVF
jgi:hypothetical protein